jgi:hypothetical protein
VLPLLTIFALWSLLAVYHRSYDVILLILFFALAVDALVSGRLNRRGRMGLLGFVTVTLIMVNFPGELIAGMLPAALAAVWDRSLDGALTLAALAMLPIAFWLLNVLATLAAGAAPS